MEIYMEVQFPGVQHDMFKLFLPNFHITALNYFIGLHPKEMNTLSHMKLPISRCNCASAPQIHSYSRMWVWDSFRPNTFLKHYTLKDTLSHSSRIWHWYFKSVFWLLEGLKLCIKQIEQNLTVWADRLLTSSNSRKSVQQGFVGGLLEAWNTMYIFNFTTMESSHMLLPYLDLFPSEVIIV